MWYIVSQVNTCTWRWSIFRFVEAFSTFNRKASSAGACSSFGLKQFEQSSFFQAFCTKRLHCVDIVASPRQRQRKPRYIITLKGKRWNSNRFDSSAEPVRRSTVYCARVANERTNERTWWRARSNFASWENILACEINLSSILALLFKILQQIFRTLNTLLKRVFIITQGQLVAVP